METKRTNQRTTTTTTEMRFAETEKRDERSEWRNAKRDQSNEIKKKTRTRI